MARQNEFTEKTKQEAFERERHRCESCGVKLIVSAANFHHRRPIQDGGTAELSNCQVLCQYCHVGTDFTFRELHPNAPPRIMFVDDLPYEERVEIAKRQQRRYEQQKREKNRRNKRNNPFDE